MSSQHKPRTGPHPLPLYMGAAQFSKVIAKNPLQLQQMIAGIQKYQNFEHPVERNDIPVVWQKGEACLLHFKAKGDEENKSALVLVPSLINKSYIFDLHPRQSFARYAVERGIDVYILDWGSSACDDMQKNFDALIMHRLLPAISFVQENTKGDVFALGYCMGGTILTAAAQQCSTLKGVCFLAAPWDFSKSHLELLRLIQGPFNPVTYFREQQETLPASYLQSLFASLDPDKAVEKFIAFNQVDATSIAAELFVAAEDWLNDGVDLPRGIAGECLTGWFRSNITASENWSIGEKIIKPETMIMPALVVASKKDRLVSYESAVCIKDRVKNAQHIVPDCGHIGMMAGRKAVTEVWDPILRWIHSFK